MESLIQILRKTSPQRFTPKPYYSPEGDSLVFCFKDVPSFRERVDDFLTIYRSMESNELVGCQIKGLRQALDLLGDFGVLIEDGSVGLGLLFMACMAASPEVAAKTQYRELGPLVKETRISGLELKA